MQACERYDILFVGSRYRLVSAFYQMVSLSDKNQSFVTSIYMDSDILTLYKGERETEDMFLILT